MTLYWDFHRAENVRTPIEFKVRPVAEHGAMRIAGVEIVDASAKSVIAMLARRLELGEATRLAFLNAHCVNLARRDAGYRERLASFAVLPDGIGVDIAAKVLYGKPFHENLNGTDFVPKMLVDIKRRCRVGLLGGRPGVADKAAKALAELAPQHSYATISHGFFKADDMGEILKSVTAGRYDIVLVAMGVPAQERFIADHLGPQHAMLTIGVGALLDFLSGEVTRAPVAIRRLRLEWLWRLALEPKRLFARYVLGNPTFLFHLALDTLALRVARRAR